MKIEIERATLQQALDALETVRTQHMAPEVHPAKTALREALAAPQQDPDALHLAAMDLARKQHDRISELEAEIQYMDRLMRASVPDRWKSCTSPVGSVQSYIAELEQRLAEMKPLTYEQIEREWQFLHDEEGNPPDHHDFARAIKSANGITKDPT